MDNKNVANKYEKIFNQNIEPIWSRQTHVIWTTRSFNWKMEPIETQFKKYGANWNYK